MMHTALSEKPTGKRVFPSLLFLVALLLGICIVLPKFLNQPPQNFPLGTLIIIDEGMNQDEITEYLEKSGVVTESLYLYFILRTQYPDEFVQAGAYNFSALKTTEEIARSITQGEDRAPLLRLTLPEGFHARDLHIYLPKELGITASTTLQNLEGYLFPDTYFIDRDTTLPEILTLLQNTFRGKLLPYSEEITANGFTEEEVIILASILEREANDETSKRMVSGILQNRLEIGMALQVDATFHYLLGKTSAELTVDDLEMDSPFNTYRYPGLPPRPIANPGIKSIEAVLRPIETEYLYYLTGNDGNFYYAETFEGHKRNKERYLR